MCVRKIKLENEWKTRVFFRENSHSNQINTSIVYKMPTLLNSFETSINLHNFARKFQYATKLKYSCKLSNKHENEKSSFTKICFTLEIFFVFSLFDHICTYARKKKKRKTKKIQSRVDFYNICFHVGTKIVYWIFMLSQFILFVFLVICVYVFDYATCFSTKHINYALFARWKMQ